MRAPVRNFRKLEDWFRRVRSSDALESLSKATSSARVLTLACVIASLAESLDVLEVNDNATDTVPSLNTSQHDSGDQLTGKSTLGKALATRLGKAGVAVQTVGSGQIFRETAAARNISVAELSSWPQEKLDQLDVEVELSTCMRIAVG